MPICFLRKLTALSQGPHFDPAASGWVTREKRQRHKANAALEPRCRNLSISLWCLAGTDALLNAAQFRRLYLAGLLITIACAPACKPNAAREYKLVTTRDGLFILPPPYFNKPASSPVHIVFPAESAREDTRRCSISDGMFRLSLTGAPSPRWLAVLPSFQAWQAAARRREFRGQLENLLDQIDGLEQRGCLSAVQSARLQEAAAESVPETASQSLYDQYRLGSLRGFVDLKPGMRLKIQRDHTASSGAFLSMSTIDYDTAQGARATLKFEPARGEAMEKSRYGAEDRSPDLTLTRQASGMLYSRLLYLGLFVPQNLGYPAFIISSRTRRRLNAITRRVAAQTGRGCPSGIPSQEARCLAFRGSVTVSVQLRVVANGKPRFIQPGDTVRGLLEAIHESRCLRAVQNLHIARRFMGRLTPAVFDPSSYLVLNLPLFAGDRISCGP